ncbi:MAG: hypothetical protein KDC84_06520 [Crocinitomicaceae bacterium]|nr:hypothetical protein [Crocinitomicaceae bacterium]
MRYLTIDGMLNGTGIRDAVNGGYILPEDLGLSSEICQIISTWLEKYASEHFKGYKDDALIEELDLEGKVIAQRIKNELKEIKLQYFSDAKAIKEIIE